MGRDQGLGGRLRLQRGADRDAERPQDGLRFDVRKHRPPFGQRAVQDHPRPGQVVALGIGLGSRGLVGQPLIQFVPGQVRKRLDSALGRREFRDPRARHGLARGGDRALAHPAAQDRLAGRLFRRFHQQVRRLVRVGHRLRRQHDQHAVEVRIIQTGSDRPGISFRRRITQDVDRIGMGPIARQEPVERLHRRFGRRREVNAEVLCPVCRQDARTAAIGDDAQPVAAGTAIERIVLSDEWLTARARREMEAHLEAIANGAADIPPMPDESLRYQLIAAQPYHGIEIPVFAAHSIRIGGQTIHLLFDVDEAGDRIHVWSEIAPGHFETTVVNGDDEPVLKVTRRFTLSPAGDITLQQELQNLTSLEMKVDWIQYGPPDMPADRSRYIDRRRIRFGHLDSQRRDPSRRVVLADRSLLLERSNIPKQEMIWPTKDSLKRDYELSWMASTNRYFALAIHPDLPDPAVDSLALTDVVSRIGFEVEGEKADAVYLTVLHSPQKTLAGGATVNLNLGVFAGAMQRSVLANREPFKTLNLKAVILYQMSSCCAVCTFPWLAEGLLRFLSLVKNIVGDWGVAIIILVFLVRGLLHPLTKRGQISMQRFSKQMSEMKPELDKLREKFGDDAKKMQQEQMRLMRERGMNPFQMLGCLPMVLQMPIWVALYAMLYFAFDIRQQPAFYGIFQKISGGEWPFLGDLSTADRFIPIFDEPRMVSFFFAFDYSSINLLPIIMGVLFFFQQKFMTPPSTAISPEQQQQQKIMKVMMVVMMPVLLYSAPAGLTLYILTSSGIGILESWYVRQHIKTMDLNPPAKKKAARSKSRDAMGRAYAKALERAEQRQKAKKAASPQKFKKRKR